MKINSHLPDGRSSAADPDLRVILTTISAPCDDLTRRIRELREAVHLLRHCAQLPASAVLATLAELDATMNDQIEPEFEQRRVGLSLPLNRPEQELYAGMSRLYRQIAKAYSTLIPERRSELTDDEVAVVGDAAWGALKYYGACLLCAYQTYQDVPRNLWRQIHALYGDVCVMGIENERPSRADNSPTIRVLYQRTLLLGLSNPYRFPFRVVRLIEQYIATHAEQSKLVNQVARMANECFFVVDPRIDRPAIPMLPRVRSSNTDTCLILDTFDLSVDLHRRIKRLCLASSRSCDRSLAGFSEAEKLETFRALLLQWGFHPIRATGRQQSSGRCELAVGLGAVSFVLNDFQPVPIFDEQTEVYTSENVIKGSFGHQQFAKHSQVSLSHDWVLVDESAEGARLLLAETGQPSSHIRIGELVAIRADGGEAWTVGTVRWAKSRGGNTFEVGVYRIGDASQALPAAVKPIQISGELLGTCSPAIVVNNPDDSSRKMLIAPKGTCRPQDTVLVKTEECERVTRIRHLELATRAFDYFVVHFDPTHRDESLRLRLPA